jgi:hypothetical protein
MLIAILATILIHELGHLLAAKAARFNVTEFRVWPLLLYRSERSWRIRFFLSLLSPCGYVRVGPSSGSRLRARMAMFALSGPAANLFCAAACVSLAIILDADMLLRTAVYTDAFDWITGWLAPNTQLCSWLSLIGSLQFTTAWSSLLPGKMRNGVATDGAGLLNALDGRRFERDTIVQQLQFSMVNGTRPRNWNADSVARMLALRENDTSDYYCNLYGYYHSVDAGQIERAGQFLNLAIDQQAAHPVNQRAWLYLEVAFYNSWFRKKAAIARSWFNQATPGQAEPQIWCRAESAILFAEARFAEAVIKAEQGLEAAVNSADRGGVQLEMDMLLGILAESRKLCNPVTDQSAPIKSSQ